MIRRLFFRDNALTGFRIILLTVLLWLPAFFTNESGPLNVLGPQMPFYQWLADRLDGMIVTSLILALVLIFFQAFLLIRINAVFLLIQERTYLPSFFYLSLTSVYLPSMYLRPELFAGIAMVFSLLILLGIGKQEMESLGFFNVGIVIGTASLLFAPIIYFIVFCWIVALVIKPFRWRDYVYPVLGCALPFFFYGSVNYLFGGSAFDIIYDLRAALLWRDGGSFLNPANITVFIIVLVLIFLSSIYMLGIFQFRKIYIRKLYLLLFWLFIMSVILFFAGGNDFRILPFLAVPVSFLMANYFISAKKSVGNAILFWTYLVALAGNALNNYFNWI